MKRVHILSVVSISICLILAAAPASGLPTLPSGKENPLQILFPELNTEAAPSWVREGLRATYYATVDQGPRDGKPRSGDALLQTDVVALEGSLVTTSTASYVRSPLGLFQPLAGAGFGSVVPAGCGDFWCSPEVLAKVPEGDDGDLTVLRGPVEAAGSTFQAVRLEVKRTGIRYSMTYDAETGLLLHHRYDIVSSDGATTETGIISLRNLRVVEIPWTGGTSPNWLRAGLTTSYRGETVFEMPGTVPTPFPVTLRAEVVSVQPKSSIIKWTAPGDAGESIPYYAASGVHQLLGFWLPATALAIDEVGDVDYDLDTGLLISVIQNDQNGIVFQETNGRDYRRLLTYEKGTGKLIGSYEERLTEAITSTVQKTSVEVTA
ncbi:hypothetical protein [Candidatus Methanocrinis natronophilus]|uniref:Uncharacterized protein n=1 Tax=Candidatus Methanocrinis natronophilus TaxID=3033396 RepID=A0ABT5X7M9_9EURY|nr:hypothetical protein [Candidatus Methanocrinis natronophilus]MDF0590700.1 hypothetical protein [Candidatus Methanocrinis natronophilus]